MITARNREHPAISESDPILAGEDLEAICGTVAEPRQINPATLEVAAGFYLAAKARRKKSAGRGLRKDLQLVSKQCRKAADALTGLPIDLTCVLIAAPRLMASGANAPTSKPDQLAKGLMYLADGVDRYLAAASGRLPELDPTIDLTMATLEIAYFHGTGRKATHSSHESGMHVSEPRSEFGRFVSAFFAVVDPKITKVELTTIVRKFVSSFEPRPEAGKVGIA